MATQTAKQKALEAVQSLPDDATMEDAVERLAFIASVERGMADSGSGRVVQHQEIRKHFRR
jgi:predicted transcriptional regulator